MEEIVPASHGVQVEDPSWLKKPGEHVAQSKDAVPLYFPASHDLHSLFSKFECVPASQDVQVEDPS